RLKDLALDVEPLVPRVSVVEAHLERLGIVLALLLVVQNAGDRHPAAPFNNLLGPLVGVGLLFGLFLVFGLILGVTGERFVELALGFFIHFLAFGVRHTAGVAAAAAAHHRAVAAAAAHLSAIAATRAHR